MPSYQYTRDIKPEDLQPEQGPELTGKEKRKNWWHYHWKIVAAIVLVGLLVAFFIAEVVRKPDADLNIVVLTNKGLPDTVTELLSEQLAELVGDVNGDGRNVVELLVCQVSIYDEEVDMGELAGDLEDEPNIEYDDPYTQMAGITRLIAALDDDSTMLFLIESELVGMYQQAYGMLGYADGSPAALDATDYENMVLAWGDSPVLTSLDLGIEYDGGVFDAQEYMDFFSVGLRQIAGTKREDSEEAVANHTLALELVNEWW